MAEKQPYPWESGKDNFIAQLESIPGPDACIPAPSFPWPLILLSGSACGLALLWLIVQFILVQPGYLVTVPEGLQKLPQASQLEILPSPTRYDFLNAYQDMIPDEENLSAETPSPSTVNPSQAPNLMPQPAAYTPPIQDATAATTIQLAPPPPIEPQFSLIGIAQGSDGNVATVKVTQNSTVETKDIRLGEPLLPGYTVTRIEDEFILVKASKGGKVIRVD